MPVKIIVTGIVLVVTSAMLMFVIEFFLPLSVKSDMNAVCRETLLKMEVAAGLSEQERQHLQTELVSKSLGNISINGTANAGQGELIVLTVEADFVYSKMNMLFHRQAVTQHMSYKKASMSRKVVN